MVEWFEEDHELEVNQERLEEWRAVVEAYRGRLGERTSRQWRRAPCPLCVDAEGKDDHKESLGYNPWTTKYRCFKCGIHGFLPVSFRSELEEDTEIDFTAAQPEAPKLPPQPATGYSRLFEEPALSSRSYAWAREYLLEERQGLTPEALREAEVGAALWGPCAGRVIVPFPDYAVASGPWRGWVARATRKDPGILPYRYAKHFDRLGYLYNEPALYVPTTDPVYVVEGAFDAIALWPDAVAVLGKPLDSHNPLFQRAKRPLCVVLDGDAWHEGQALAWSLAHRGKMAYAVRLPPKVDPDEVGKPALRALYEQVLRG